MSDVWVKRILKALGVPIMEPILLYYDNMSNIHLDHNSVFHTRTTHIEVHYDFIRECILAGDINLQHKFSTHLQMADIFTNALGFNKLR